MHGDIKRQNVLVFDGEEGKGEYLAKVTDFGYSGMLMVDAVRVTGARDGGMGGAGIYERNERGFRSGSAD